MILTIIHSLSHSLDEKNQKISSYSNLSLIANNLFLEGTVLCISFSQIPCVVAKNIPSARSIILKRKGTLLVASFVEYTKVNNIFRT